MTRSGRLLCQEHDRIAIPEDVPALGIRKGDEGIISKLDLYNETVFAFVMDHLLHRPDEGMGHHGDQTADYKVRSFTTTPG